MRKTILGNSLRAAVCAGILLLPDTPSARADETLPVLRVGSDVYTNVTITGVTATDIYFNYAGGMGTAKLKKLEPALQKHFHFDPSKAGAAEKQQLAGNFLFRVALAASAPARRPRPAADSEPSGVTYDDGDVVVTRLYARSIRGQHPPPIIIAQWLTPPPDVDGKFILVEFWQSTSAPCRQAIPHLNDLYSRFKDRLVVIGLSDDTPEDVLKVTSPAVEYSLGIDPAARTLGALEVRAVPHAILIDPKGIVRFEGLPGYLTDDDLERLMDKYGG